ncbi:hypothetical protein Tco_0019426 [Tanacetum coccineum]
MNGLQARVAKNQGESRRLKMVLGFSWYAARFSIWFPTKNVTITPCELWYGKVPNLSLLKGLGMYVGILCERLYKPRNQWEGEVVLDRNSRGNRYTPSEITSTYPVEVLIPPQEEVIPDSNLVVECFAMLDSSLDRDDTSRDWICFVLNEGSGLEELQAKYLLQFCYRMNT